MHPVQALQGPDHPPRAHRLLLRVRHGQRNWLFEFPPGDQRAVIVGSRPTVDIRISAPAVAPVHFHFEREGDGIWLIPGYQAPVTLNHICVLGPYLLPLFAVVDLSSERLEIEVYDEPQTAPTSSEQETVRRPAFKLDVPVGHPLAQTVRMPGSALGSRSFIPDPSLLDTIAWQQPSLAPPLAPPPKPLPTPPIEISVPRGSPVRPSWLTRLGLLTRRRPLLVTLVAAMTALIFALGSRRLTHVRSPHTWSPCAEPRTAR